MPLSASAGMIGSVPPERVSSGRIPSACSNASSASRIAGASGSTSPGAAPPTSTPTSAPAGAASRTSRLRRRADRVDVLARREPDRELAGRVHRQRRVPHARLAAEDPVHVRGRLGPRAHVELLRRPSRRAAARPGPRAPRRPGGSVDHCASSSAVGGAIPARSGSGRRPSGPASTASKQRMSTWIALSAAPPYIPECRSRSPVPHRDVERDSPRVARSSDGTSTPSMPPSKMTPASAPRSSCAR